MAFSGWSVLAADTAAAQVATPVEQPPATETELPEAPVLSADYRPHRGLYVAAHAGLGNLRVTFPRSSTANSGTYAISGKCVPLGLELGLAAAENLVVFGQLYDMHVFSSFSDYAEFDALDLYGFGPGLKYYFIPRNVFVASSLLISQLRYDTTRPSYNTPTHWGAVGRLAVGGELWVSPSWAIGIAGEAMYGRIGGKAFDSNPGPEYTAKGLSLLVSTSFSFPPGPACNQVAAYAESGPTSEDDGPAQIPCVTSGGYHTHDGFYLSARLGLGWLWASADGDGFASGSGYPFGLSAGYALGKNLILFGEIYDLPIPRSSSTDGWNNLEFLGFGPGVKRYLPWNTFVSGSVLIARFHDDGGSPGDTRYGYSATSRWGWAGRLSAGKEWWVSANWGLGIAGEGFVGRMTKWPEAGDIREYTYTVKGFSLLASASFN